MSREAAEVARRIMRLREAHRGLITEKLGKGAARALTLLEVLFKTPFTSVTGIKNATQLSASNANNLASKFLDLGILKEATGQRRNLAFVYDEYLGLFEDRDEAERDDP